MALAFCFGLMLYFGIAFRAPSMQGAVLSKTLWALYFLLGVSGSIILFADGIPTVYPSNYVSTIFLTACILLCVWAFRNVRSVDVARLSPPEAVVRPVENFLITIQLLSIIYFLPFAIGALLGDPGAYRLALDDSTEVLASYGLINTFAGHASHLFTASLVLAFLRLSATAKTGRDLFRAALLIGSSFSWVIYVLAYAGRDGVVYWVINAVALYLLFRQRLAKRDRARIIRVAPIVGAVLLVPMFTITVSRFFTEDGAGFWALFEYFGAQIQNFSDYSSLDRPRTNGLRTLPLFYGQICNAIFANCETWSDIQSKVFDEYLVQGKEPWLFGTFVSDLVGDFGYLGSLLVIGAFAAAANLVCKYRDRCKPMSLSRLLAILLLFQIPLWGVFYFRFAIANGFLVVNIALCLGVLVLERIATANRKHFESPASHTPNSMLRK